MITTVQYEKLNKPIQRGSGSEPLDELKVNVDYHKGGYNYFSGDMEANAIYVYITPIHRGDMFTTYTLLGDHHSCGYKIKLKELSRKSQKQIDLMAEKVIPHSKEIAELYSDGKHCEIFNLIMELIK